MPVVANPQSRPALGRGARRGFTLIELLVTIAIVGIMLALLLPAIGATMRSARSFRCQMSLRSVAFDFSVFGDDQMHGDRGDDESELGPRHFRLSTFIESQYGIDEFWAWGSATTHSLPDAAKNDPMRCPDVRGEVTVSSETPCTQGAVEPARHVSYGFNMRLHMAEVSAPSGPPFVYVKLSSAIAQESMVPFAWDVDGAEAEQRGVNPLFSAPAAGSTGPLYANSQYWFPASRHQGQGNFAFLDNSVRSSRRALEQSDWRWSYQPVR